ncbi:MAG: hypothetical protein COS36_01255 [Candidatus Altarchaeum sp. CG03_land_8_20_14_0_80_32_618]|nr:MAG: hypothetical protein COS36_01255 [Candidatus Altarchaeum sp. CG03_land_8_20_14_0_80_32_618]PIZ30867.1 MAG: hypothetical protein COY41_03475 [Candidatus Altarchaeum sp. CG_4_10_14_0_8_um_filter_32_851]
MKITKNKCKNNKNKNFKMTDKNFIFKIGVIVLLSIGLAMSVSADWPMFHHDTQQTGYIETSSAPGKNHTIWNFSATLSHSSPVITDGKVIITSVKDNQIYALSESNGSKIWNKSISNLAWSYSSGGIIFYFSFTPAVVGDTIYVGTGDCKIYALNLSNGGQLWNFTGNGRTASFLTVANNKVIFRCHRDGNTNDTLYLLNASNGDKTFEKNFSYFSAKTINPAISVAGIAYTEIYRCKMSAINLSNGNIEWNFTVTEEGCGSVGLSPPVLINDKLIFGTDKGYVYFVNTTNIFQYNKTYLNGEYIASKMAPAVWKDRVFIGTGIRSSSTYGNFYAINLTNYSVAWTYPVGDAIQSAPAVADGKVFFLAENNKFYALNALEGTLNWSYATPNVGWIENDIYTSSPAISDGVVAIGVPEGEVYAFKTIQLVFVRVAWDDNIANFNNTVQQHANYFLEKSGLNACGMKVEIKIVNGSPDITGQQICDAWNTNNINHVLEGIKNWALNNGVRGDRYIGLTTYDMENNCGVGGYTQLPYDIHYDTAIVYYNDPALSSHELGHTYMLCDEYNFSDSGWTQENNDLLQAGLGSCPNNVGCTLNDVCNCSANGAYHCIQGVCYHPTTTSPTYFYYYLPSNPCNTDSNYPFYNPNAPNKHSPDSDWRCISLTSYALANNYCKGLNCASKCSCAQLNLYGNKNSSLLTEDGKGYICGKGGCNGSSFECLGYRFSDDRFSIMSAGDLPLSDYSSSSVSHLHKVLCGNHGFVAIPPLATYNGASGVGASKCVTKSTNQKDGNYLKVSFVVRKDGTGSFKNVEILKDGQIADVPRGDYSIVLKNNRREVLYTKSFGVSFVAMGDPPKKYNDTSITFTIPYVNGAKSMEIRKGNKVLFSTPIPIINNGGFETGDFTGWTAGGPGDHKVDTQVPYIGKYSALIGFRDHNNVANGYDYIYQTIELPLGKESELSFYYRFYSYDYCNYDFFTMYIKDENGNVLATPVNRCLGGNGLEDTGWTNVKYNLTPYAGQKIQIYFEVSNRYDTAYNSWAYVDNVTITSISQPINNGFETGNLTGWNVGGDGCYPNWVTIVNISSKPGLVRSGNYAAVGNAAWTGSYSNSLCATGWYCQKMQY